MRNESLPDQEHPVWTAPVADHEIEVLRWYKHYLHREQWKITYCRLDIQSSHLQ